MTQLEIHTERREDNMLLNARLDALHGDVGEIKTAMKDLTAAITKLALVEERQSQASAALERAFDGIARVDSRVTTLQDRVIELEKHDVGQNRIVAWADKAVWGAAGLLAMYAAKVVGLL